MSTAVAITTEATPLTFDDNQTRLTEKVNINREKTRYVACLGNHLEAGDRRQLTNIGGWAGGIWVGHSEIEGCPTMKRTHHMILRGLFTPLEMRAIQRKADHRETEFNKESYLDGPGIPPFTRGYTVYPGDDLGFLQSDRYQPMGVVELTGLMGVDWNSELRRSLQEFFFPQWKEWQQGVGEVPVLLSDWTDIVKNAQKNARYESHELIAEQLLESARLFSVYALNQIERNRQAIQSMRSADHGGQYVGWHNKCRTYAEQLGITLEDEKTIAGIASPDNTGLIAEMRADRKLREQELATQTAINKALVEKLTGEKIELPEVKIEEPKPIDFEKIAQESVQLGVPSLQEERAEEVDLAPVAAETDLTPGCTEFNGKGDPCRGKVQPGETKCVFHGGKSQKQANEG